MWTWWREKIRIWDKRKALINHKSKLLQKWILLCPRNTSVFGCMRCIFRNTFFPHPLSPPPPPLALLSLVHTFIHVHLDGGILSLIVIIIVKWNWWSKFKSLKRQLVFHFLPMPMKKKWTLLVLRPSMVKQWGRLGSLALARQPV